MPLHAAGHTSGRKRTVGMRDWELCLLMTLLSPVFWLQGKYVRRVTPHMPDATSNGFHPSSLCYAEYPFGPVECLFDIGGAVALYLL
jgi:hypothetical protein